MTRTGFTRGTRMPRVVCSVCGFEQAGDPRKWGTGGWYIQTHRGPDGGRCLGDTRTDHEPVAA